MIIKAEDFDAVELKIVSGVVEGFAHRLSMGFAGTKSNMLAYYTYIEPLQDDGEIMAEPQVNDVMIDLIIEIGSRTLSYKEIVHENLRQLNGVQYYAATILIMFMLFGASFGVTLFLVERDLKTLRRLLTTRASRASLILGKFSGISLVTLTQALLLILFSRFVYRVDWGGSLVGMVLITLCSVIACSSMGMFIASIVRTQKAASGISQLIIHVFNILGGGMVPLRMLPDVFKNIGKISINWWSATAFHNLMMGYSIEKIVPYCLVLLAMSAVYLMIGIARFRID
jgi:ABC-type multidrug transport system permease subunit